MLEKIYLKRYGKALILLGLLIAFLYSFHPAKGVIQWHHYKQYLDSSRFEKDYKQDIANGQGDVYAIEYDEEGFPTKYISMADYRRERLVVFDNKSENLLPYQYGSSYYQLFNLSYPLIFGLVALLGFSFFFIDQKTQFNRFLFSLGYSRKTLFFKKMKTILIPFSIWFAICSFFPIIITKLGIPAEYLNLPLKIGILSALSHWLIIVAVFSMGIFFGTLLGNIVTGPLSFSFGVFMLSFSPQALYGFRYLLERSFPNIDLTFHSFVDVPANKILGWPAVVIYLSLIISFILGSLLVYKRIPLENDGQFILLSKLQIPLFITISLLVSFYMLLLTSGEFKIYDMYYETFEWMSGKAILINYLGWLSLISFFSFILIFHQNIYQRWLHFRLKK